MTKLELKKHGVNIFSSAFCSYGMAMLSYSFFAMFKTLIYSEGDDFIVIINTYRQNLQLASHDTIVYLYLISFVILFVLFTKTNCYTKFLFKDK